MTTIKCRAKIADDCLDGKPEPPDEEMAGDGTFDGESVVCTPCYALLIPFSMSGAALESELQQTIEAYQEMLAFIRNHPEPEVLEADAAGAMEANADRPFTPYYRTAKIHRDEARKEIDRRRAAKESAQGRSDAV